MTPRLQVRKRALHTRYWLLAGVLALGLSCQPEAGEGPSPELAAQAQAAAGQTQQTAEPMPAPGSIPASPVAPVPIQCARTLTADVVALDQVYTYNRFGAFNPVGMIYALKHDVEAVSLAKPIGPGNARLRPGKRPRPLVLRANVGDCLRITFTNWLAPTRSGIHDPQNSQPSPNVGQQIFRKQLRTWVPNDLYDALASMLAGSPVGGRWFEPREAGDFNMHNKDNSPFTREASVHVQGLQYVNAGSDGAYVGNNPSTLVAPGNTATYTYHADHEGTFFFYSMGASFGGQGDGGSTVMGLFGTVNVEPAGSKWYRSKVSNAVLVAAQRRDTAGNLLKNPDGTPLINYDALDASGNPLLAVLHPQTLAIRHGDLEAIITGYSSTVMGTSTSRDVGHFREITAIYHDEVKAIQAFDELEWNPTFHSVKDGFGVNYGVAGLGAELLANRAKLGPTKDCTECLYEEFFLESWANGDPAMNVEHDSTGRAVRALYPDDPSNVHHSYLGDPVRIRNIHAGPAETHVFHLHAHQWKFSPGLEDSNYLDSQTIGPGSAYTYDINFGGSGNRNLTVGDSIHHCHLYPHFAQGMWALWRVHDVFEAGTSDRNLPDGEIAGGTPNPAVIPIPNRVMPPMPTYAPTVVSTSGGNVTRPAFPGYPFYIAAKAGHRPPQPPLDIQHDGGLPRHVVTSDPGPTTFGEPGKRFKVNHTRLNLKLLPQNGTPLEQSAMAFHAGSFPNAAPATTLYGDTVSSYPGYTALGGTGRFLVNGRPATGGAPYADPCPAGAPQRTYKAAYLQIALQRMNRAGWHDPQARIMVLNDDVAATRNGTRPAEPFFFRAQSGECINFHATNLIPRELLADDFQIYTPTDTIGQHIHLVKFDVTASDGAGNGWNYEDGTFAADEVLHRIELANAAGGAFPVDGTLNETGTRVRLTPTTHPLLGVQGAQTTMQRWWADPLKNPAGVDKTVETVFTHDHFGPSSHQQHGLYGALIVEPEGSQWRDPRTGVFYGSRTSDGGPTSWRADVLMRDASQHFREFALAFADFGLSYDECGKPVNPPNFKEKPLPIAIGFEDQPMPEAISSRDPGGMFINYRNEPIPHRISTRANCGDRTQRTGLRGDMANVFRSDLHGDPYTPLLRGYQGDKVKIRLIQGAQEEQHSFTMHGHKWLREVADPNSGLANAQAVGISEHFEFKLANGLPVVGGPYATADYMYQSASNGDLWNGMWGILRTYKFRQRNVRTLGDVALMAVDDQPLNPYDPVNLLTLPYPTTTSTTVPETWDEADLATRDAAEKDTAYQGSYVVDENGNAIEQRTVDYLLEAREKMESIDPVLVQEAEAKGRIGPGKPVPLDSCPNGARVRSYRVSAIDARNHLPGSRLVYNSEYKIYDPDAVIFVKNEHLAAVKNGTRRPEPLILRARAGECVQVTLTNLLPSTPPLKTPQWAHHSPITPNFNVNQVRPSTHVSLHPQLVNVDINTDDGANVGLNAVQTVAPGRSRTYRWYAGDLRRTGTGSTVTPVEFGIVNLRNMADVVNHGMHGSIGALIIEPASAVWSPDTDSEAQARVTYTKANGTTETFREFVLLFQDDLGLHTDEPRFQDTDGLNSGTALRNLAGADDAEDTGHKAFNYRTEPLWGRLGLPPQTDPETINDLNLSAILSSAVHGAPATPILTVARGERLRLRVGQPSGHSRQHAFALHGVEWRRNPWASGATSRFMGDNATSPVISTQGGMSVMQHWNFVPLQPAGGAAGLPMDYLYRDMSSFQWSYGGLWGVMRVQ